MQDIYPRSAPQPFFIKALPTLLASNWVWPMDASTEYWRGWRVMSGFDSDWYVLLKVMAPLLSCGPLHMAPILTPRNCTLLSGLRELTG